MIKFTHIPTLIKKHRLSKGISQHDISKHLGYKNGQMFSNIERGLCSLPVNKMHILSKLLGIPREDLLMAYLSDKKDSFDRDFPLHDAD